MLYIVSREFVPTSAASNRLLGWAKGFSNLGLEAQCVFFAPSDNYDKCPINIPNITFKYYWERFYLKGIYTKFFSYAFYIISFIASLEKGDIVYIYSSLDILRWIAIRRKSIKIYVEITEHPEVSLPGNRFYRPTTQDLIDCCKKIDGLFVISSNLRDFFIAKGLKSNCVHIVNMTVDAFRFERLSKNRTEPYFVYCGNASSNKKDGVNQLIQAFAITHQKHPDVKLYIIGPKPKINEPNNNYNLVKKLGIENYVMFLGTITSDFLPQYLVNSVACVLDRPNNKQAKYGFPTKLGEYLLSERPTIVTDVGNMKDFLTDGLSALIVEPDNIQSFAEKMKWCLEHKSAADVIGKNGAEVSKKEFNCLIETKKIVNVIFSK